MDFNYIANNTVGFLPVLKFIFMGTITGMSLSLVILIFLTLFSNKDVSKKFSILLILGSTIICASALPIIVHPQSSTTENKTAQNESFRKWVSENYLIDLNEKQADKLIQYQIDETIGNSTIKDDAMAAVPVTVKDAYGNEQNLKLVKTSETEWELTTTQTLQKISPPNPESNKTK
jgi:hypothetical protein